MMPTGARPRLMGGRKFENAKNHFVDIGRKMEAVLGSKVFILVVRGRKFHDAATTRPTPGAQKWKPADGTARRLKELCNQMRKSMVRQANRLRSEHKAQVYTYILRKDMEYVHRADPRKVRITVVFVL